ncbi:MAG: head GIN domain-containing protein, partial [Cyclobacteriaceae bacterium]
LHAQTVKRDREVPPFSGLEVGGAFHVEIKQGNTSSLSIEAQEDLHEDIETKVSGGILRIYMDWPRFKWDRHEKIYVYIQVKELEHLDVSGAGHLKSTNTIVTDRLDLDISGAGHLDLDLDARTLQVEVSGAGDTNLEGKAVEQNVILNGAGVYDASDLSSERTTIKSSGAGSASVRASKAIEAKATGASNIRYYGDPEKVMVNSSGAGSIIKR